MMKILILEANPRQDLSLDKEIRSLRSVIDDAGDRSKFGIKDGAAVRKDQLQKLMLAFEAEEPKDDPIIVHFCGHGTGEKGLVFEDRQGNIDLVSTNTLTDFFALFEKRVVCVVMNACYSEVQAEAINKHIKYVIGMNQAIRDDAAIAFSIGFYRALGYGKSVEDAFKFGKNAIQLAIGDDPKSREGIAEEMRKLVPIGEISEAFIEEHLKPELKVNPGIIITDEEADRKIDYKELNQAFLDAYQTYDQLEMMVELELNQKLPEIVPSTLPLKKVVFTLIKDFQRRGKLFELLKGAYKDNQDNNSINKVYKKYSD